MYIRTGFHLSQISLKPEKKRGPWEEWSTANCCPCNLPWVKHILLSISVCPDEDQRELLWCSFLLSLLASTNYDPNVALKNPKTESLSTSFPFQIILLMINLRVQKSDFPLHVCFRILISPFLASWIPRTKCRGSVRKSSLNCLMLQMSLLTVYKYLLCSSQALSWPKHRLNSTAVQVTLESCIGQTLTALTLSCWKMQI